MPPSKALLERVSAVLGRHVRRGDRLVAGLSGGIDSVVMLDLLRRAAAKMRFEIAALHVNHQINPAAAKWARFCGAYCRQLGIGLTVVKVNVPRESSLEAAARNARYAAFARLPADFVALAHNLDDQAETVLLQLLRGAGVKGVSAMPVLRGDARGQGKEEKKRRVLHASPLAPSILRPLLDITRAEIEAYARARKLRWVEDDSNADTGFDRNFMRHRLLPVIAERYPAYRKTLARASRNFAEAAVLLDELASIDMPNAAAHLKITDLRALTTARAKNALRYFLGSHGVTMPNETRLAECVRQVQEPRATGIAIDLGAHELRRFGSELRVVPKTPVPAADFRRQWQGEARLALPELGATLLMKKSRGSGLSLAKLQTAAVTVRLRTGGERLRPDAKRPRRSLKNLLQEARLPPWLRARLPLLYCGDTLVYVPGVGIDTAFRAHSGEPAVEPQWQPDSSQNGA
ncbi:MAG TPA: tRNA lysidine(34) synthetase TilS [Burkholderiales bacterium]|nr:tRNA lysidine(34) synthetase TilS [Burkholderiales bacterium]